MRRAIRERPTDLRVSERIPMHARLSLTTLDGKPVAPLSRCTDIGIGGLRCEAATGLAPGTQVLLALELPSGRVLEARGHVTWLKTTLHLALFGTPGGLDDDALFGIAFDGLCAEELRPIARLLAEKKDELRRARRIRSHYGLPSRG